jgi:hypothetical protein
LSKAEPRQPRGVALELFYRVIPDGLWHLV